MNDEPAFPTNITPGNIEGMSLLDYFAAEAMKVVMQNAVLGKESTMASIANNSYYMAKAMMSERKRRSEVKE